jgi:hypothetical protein
MAEPESNEGEIFRLRVVDIEVFPEYQVGIYQTPKRHKLSPGGDSDAADEAG